MFLEGSRKLNFLATVTPSLVMIGAPNFFSIPRCGPWGEGDLTASARIFTPRKNRLVGTPHLYNLLRHF